MDCEEEKPLDLCQKYGAQFKCKVCHNSYRYCRDHIPGWSKMSAAEKKKKAIIANKRDEAAKGRKRTLISQTAV